MGRVMCQAVCRWTSVVWRWLRNAFHFFRGACKEIADLWSTHFWQ